MYIIFYPACLPAKILRLLFCIGTADFLKSEDELELGELDALGSDSEIVSETVQPFTGNYSLTNEPLLTLAAAANSTAVAIVSEAEVQDPDHDGDDEGVDVRDGDALSGEMVADKKRKKAKKSRSKKTESQDRDLLLLDRAILAQRSVADDTAIAFPSTEFSIVERNVIHAFSRWSDSFIRAKAYVSLRKKTISSAHYLEKAVFRCLKNWVLLPSQVSGMGGPEAVSPSAYFDAVSAAATHLVDSFGDAGQDKARKAHRGKQFASVDSAWTQVCDALRTHLIAKKAKIVPEKSHEGIELLVLYFSHSLGALCSPASFKRGIESGQLVVMCEYLLLLCKEPMTRRFVLSTGLSVLIVELMLLTESVLSDNDAADNVSQAALWAEWLKPLNSAALVQCSSVGWLLQDLALPSKHSEIDGEDFAAQQKFVWHLHKAGIVAQCLNSLHSLQQQPVTGYQVSRVVRKLAAYSSYVRNSLKDNEQVVVESFAQLQLRNRQLDHPQGKEIALETLGKFGEIIDVFCALGEQQTSVSVMDMRALINTELLLDTITNLVTLDIDVLMQITADKLSSLWDALIKLMQFGINGTGAVAAVAEAQTALLHKAIVLSGYLQLYPEKSKKSENAETPRALPPQALLSLLCSLPIKYFTSDRYVKAFTYLCRC
jgi:hypothetical protein